MRQPKRPVPLLLLLALGSSACARSVEEWQLDLTGRWSDDFHRGMAAIALAEQAPDHAAGAVVPLIRILDGPEGPMRPHAAASLRKLAPWSAEELVAALVDTPFLSEETRIPLEEAVLAAGDRAVAPLVARMSDARRLEPEQIALILARIGEPAVDPLLAILRDEREAVRDAAARALADVYVVRASTLEGPAREEVLREVVRLGDAAVPSLLERIAAGGPRRVRAARECLLAIAARRAAGAFR